MGENLFGFYPKPLRLPIGKKLYKKEYMPYKKAVDLLEDKVIIEEKMDGKPVLLIGEKYLVLAEDLKETRSIKYKVPARFAIFDIYNRKNGVLSFRQKISAYYELKYLSRLEPFRTYPTEEIVYPDSMFMVRVIAIGNFKLKDLPSFITYSPYAAEPNTYMEGIVVKSYNSIVIGSEAGKIIANELNYQVNRIKQKHKTTEQIEYNIIDPQMKEINPIIENIIFFPSGLISDIYKYKIKQKN
ncbi:MAG: hypothetical protein QXV83_01135 [Candidatus Anstonellaceae archaeon]